jgi:hypothetical protein
MLKSAWILDACALLATLLVVVARAEVAATSPDDATDAVLQSKTLMDQQQYAPALSKLKS